VAVAATNHGLTIHGAMPEDMVLSEWRYESNVLAVGLTIITLIVGGLGHVFSRGVKARTNELEAYRDSLKATIDQRTSELTQHDALLEAVTESAAELFGSDNPDEAVTHVLGLIGSVESAARVHVHEIRRESDGRWIEHLKYAWHAPGLESILGSA